MQKNFIYICCCIFLAFLSQETSAFDGKFITGLGYLAPEKYRRDNEINPLPFGLSVIPMIAYRSRTLNILGPRVSYVLFGSIARLSVNVNMAGDRYKANTIKEKETAVHAGFSLAIPFINLRYEQDLSSRHNSAVYIASLNKRFKFGDSIFARIAIGREFLDQKYTTYYYGVSAEEAGTYQTYRPKREQNTVINFNGSYSFDEENSIALNITHRRFGSEIANSPTIRLKNFNIFGLFWNYTI